MSMFGLGMPEIIIILIIALIVFGPGKLPDIGKTIGQGIRDFKNAMEKPDEEKNDNNPKSPNDEKK